jgi:hypothetical protein
MGLGTDNTICTSEFIEAMRAKLEAEEPGSGKDMDNPDVQKNFVPFGQAVYRIATVRADLASDATADAVFWQWVSDVNTWLKGLSAWQKGVAQAFSAWSPTLPAEVNLRSALIAVAQPGPPPAVAPSGLKGKIT